MTIIQPNRASTSLTLIVWGLVAVTMIAAVWLVFLYNKAMNIAHAVEETRDRIEEVNVASSELKERSFALLDSSKFEEIALESGLVKDSEPAYFEVDTQWSIASVSQY